MNDFYYCRKGNEVSLEASGDLVSVTAEIARMIQRIHHAIKRQSPNAASAFRVAIIAAVAAEDSPVWLDPGNTAGDTCICAVWPNK